VTGRGQLLASLSEASCALEGGDPAGAAAALELAVRACGEIDGAPARLDAASLSEARRLLAACVEAAGVTRARLLESLEHAGRSRRAISAYRR